MSEDINKSPDEYFKEIVESKEKKISQSVFETPKENKTIQPTLPPTNTYEETDFFTISIQELPCSKFYPSGAMIKLRSATVKEIQSYSMVDDKNYYDIIEKMNDILASCVRIKYADGSIGTYLDFKDPDRIYLIFLVRELTFQKGNTMKTQAYCDCGKELSIEVKRENFVKHNPTDLDEWFDEYNKTYTFETKDNNIYHFAPPTIGIQKSFSEYIVNQTAAKKKINMSFLKIIPFLMAGRNSITQEGIEKKLREFENLDMETFQFLNDVVSRMTFGIDKLKKTCSCGLELHTDLTFPGGASAIFVVRDSFKDFIKK